MVQVVLGLGSNKSIEINNQVLSPVNLLRCACEKLKKICSGDSFYVSSVYETKAMYYENQNNFFNMIAVGNYEGYPETLLEEIHLIESLYGRDRTKEIQNGPRSIDIDIELFGSLIINSKDLVIPHEKIKERAFVLVPLLEILKDCAEPISNMKYSYYYQQLQGQEIKRFCDPFKFL